MMMPLVDVNQQGHSNHHFIYMNLTVVATTELTNDLKQKTE